MPTPKGSRFAVGNKGGGRFSQLNPNFIRRAELACRAGFTDRELAELFDVSLFAIQKWERQIGEIRIVNENNKKHPGGRPNKFRPEYVEQARKLCQFRHTDPELAEFFGVHLQTINNGKAKYPEFSHAFRSGNVVGQLRQMAYLSCEAVCGTICGVLGVEQSSAAVGNGQCSKG
jgi:hypothetical protein